MTSGLKTVTLGAVVLVVACEKRTSPDCSGDAARPQAAAATVAPKSGRVRPQVDFTVRSDIPGCLSVVRKDTTEQENLLLAKIETTTTHITADCGCTSRWLLYRSVAEREGIETELASGSLLAGPPGAPSVGRLVVLLSERSHPPTDALILHIGCAPAP
jgi:hypothetical protein